MFTSRLRWERKDMMPKRSHLPPGSPLPGPQAIAVRPFHRFWIFLIETA